MLAATRASTASSSARTRSMRPCPLATPARPTTRHRRQPRHIRAGGGESATFTNVPLTNIIVSVDSQVDCGTSSSITCPGVLAAQTGANGDGSLTLSDLVPGAYTCVVVVDS